MPHIKPSACTIGRAAQWDETIPDWAAKSFATSRPYIRVNKFLKFTTIKAHFNILLANGEVTVNWSSRSIRMPKNTDFLIVGKRSPTEHTRVGMVIFAWIHFQTARSRTTCTKPKSLSPRSHLTQSGSHRGEALYSETLYYTVAISLY